MHDIGTTSGEGHQILNFHQKAEGKNTASPHAPSVEYTTRLRNAPSGAPLEDDGLEQWWRCSLRRHLPAYVVSSETALESTSTAIF